jgi:hypothetical protein
MAKSYAVYNNKSQLVEIFTNKLTAVESIVSASEWEVRTYKYLTAQQIKSLSYVEAISTELKLRSENSEVLEMISETHSNPKMKYGE